MLDHFFFVLLIVISVVLLIWGIFWKRWDAAEKKWRSKAARLDRLLLHQAKADMDGQEE